jgi:hypothetical protein
MGAMGTILAMVGLYGLVAYSVSRRTREIGIRMALGADRRSVVWMVLRQRAAAGRGRSGGRPGSGFCVFLCVRRDHWFHLIFSVQAR